MPSSSELPNENRHHDRKKLLEWLLVERLGLGDDRFDPEIADDLPHTMPEPAGRAIRIQTRRDLEAHLNLLAGAGCNRKVLYWCLERLGMEAERRRAGEVTHKVYEEDLPVKSWTKDTALPTREDMKAVSSKLQSALKAIRKHQDVLLMASDVLGDESGLPKGGLLSPGPVTNIEAMLMLRQSLSWAMRLADSWQGLNQKQQMKSLGPLYLLEYVWMCARNTAALNGPKIGGVLRRKTNPARLEKHYAENVRHLVSVYSHGRFRAEDLIDKRQDFEELHPTLHARMLSLLKNLEASATSNLNTDA
jgi:hypothetical protein